ncbi:TRAP transporter small permease [Phaeovulum sp.]|uniref:TRAP transporter small permease n=1 Tax=Phaeovulum sp. TaxID=2934796 RepID=UPI003564BB92
MPFQSFLRSMEGVAKLLNVIGTLVVLALVVVINADVFARNVLHAPFRGVFEAVQLLMVLIVFLQLPDVVRMNRLTRSDGFLAILADRYPRIGNPLARIIDLISAAFMLLIVWTIYPEFTSTLENGRYFGVRGVFTLPAWPQYLAITIGAALSALLFIGKAISGSRHPAQLKLEDSGA